LNHKLDPFKCWVSSHSSPISSVPFFIGTTDDVLCKFRNLYGISMLTFRVTI
jgi:hypothetical protein